MVEQRITGLGPGQPGDLFELADLLFDHTVERGLLGRSAFLECGEFLLLPFGLLAAGGRFLQQGLGPGTKLFGLTLGVLGFPAQRLDRVGGFVERGFAVVDALRATVELFVALFLFLT